MRIIKQSDELLVLSGTPGGMKWMAFMGVMGATMSAFVVYLINAMWSSGGWSMGMLPLGFGFLLGQLFFWMGVVALFGRQRLVFDKAARTGAYTVFSPIVKTAKPFKFSFDHIHSVTLSQTTEVMPSQDSQGRSSSRAVEICSAKLRTTKPRRSVLLDETQNGRDQRVTALAEAVAGFLDLPVTRGS